MDIDDKVLQDLAGQLGGNMDKKKKETVEEVAKEYMGKSDDQLLSDLMKLKNEVAKDPEQFQKQMKAIKGMRAFMNKEQQAKLDQLLKIFEG